MTLIGNYNSEKQTALDLQTKLGAQTQDIENVTVALRQIDPKLVGESRYNTNHWLITRLFLAIATPLWFGIKDVYFRKDIKSLEFTKPKESDISDTRQKLAEATQKVAELTLAITKQVEEVRPTLTAKEAELGGIEAQIRALNPTALGGKRYDETAHWSMTTKMFDTFYYAKDTWNSSTLNSLMASRAQCERELGVIRKTLAPLEDAIKVEKTPEEAKPAVDPFDALVITDEQKAKIQDLIPSVANDSLWSLIGKYFSVLMPAKESLKSLHPLRSLGFILGTPALRKDIITLSEQPQRWVGYMGKKGFKPETADKLKAYHNEGKILPSLPGFAKSLGLDDAQLQQLTDLAKADKWQDFIQTLVEIAKTLK